MNNPQSSPQPNDHADNITKLALLNLVCEHLMLARAVLSELAAHSDMPTMARTMLNLKAYSIKHDIDDLQEEIAPWVFGQVSASSLDWSLWDGDASELQGDDLASYLAWSTRGAGNE